MVNLRENELSEIQNPKFLFQNQSYHMSSGDFCTRVYLHFMNRKIKISLNRIIYEI